MTTPPKATLKYPQSIRFSARMKPLTGARGGAGHPEFYAVVARLGFRLLEFAQEHGRERSCDGISTPSTDLNFEGFHIKWGGQKNALKERSLYIPYNVVLNYRGDASTYA